MLDLIVRGGKVIDGTGTPMLPADIGVEGDRIVEVGDLASAQAERIIDATGRYVTPGFVDIHTHSDITVMVNPRMESKVRQGVTLEVGGNCGHGYAPVYGRAVPTVERDVARYGLQLRWNSLAEYFSVMEAQGIAGNFATFVAHGSVRESAMGFDMRPPTQDELSEMKRLLAQSLEEGAVGFTSGLIYPPSAYADTQEFIELARVAARYGGVYGTHMRNQGEGLLDSIADALRIGEEGGVPVQVSHLKATGKRAWGRVPQALEVMDRARQRGIDVTFDRYPYIAASTGLSAVLPRWAHEGGVPRMIERLRSPDVRRQIAGEISEPTAEWDSFGANVGWENIMVAQCASDPQYAGMRISEIAAADGKGSIETAFDLLVANEGHVPCVLFSMCQEDVDAALRDPACMIGSDGYALAPYGPLGEGKPHPRSYGTFPRLLAEYVREKGLLTWEQAVASMTARTADRLGFPQRGRVKAGYYADLVVLNPDTVSDRATFLEPHQYPEGIDYVVVNGTVVVDRGEHTGALAGRVLRRGA